MLIHNFCNKTTSIITTDICQYDFYISLISFIIILLLISLFIYIKWIQKISFANKKRCTDLFYLHNIRSFIVIILLIINIFEVAESSLTLSPPYGYVASPLAMTSVLLTMLSTILLTIFVRFVEVRDKPGWIYIVLLCELIQFIIKLLKFIFIEINIIEKNNNNKDLLFIYNLQEFLFITTVVLLILLCLIDCFTIYNEFHSSTKRVHVLMGNTDGGTTSNNDSDDINTGKIGYRHPRATFLSKLTFCWLTPLLWKGYWVPLELNDLGHLYEDDSSRFQYDQFLFIYQSFKDKHASLWYCYFKSCWRLFLVGGILKLIGDITALVGPLSITQIVEYIENLNKTTTNNDDRKNLIIINNKHYYPTWHDFLTNGWIISVIVLISSIAQGTCSQASTHIVNMVGIRLKTAIQGLVYRKTLLTSIYCFHNETNEIKNSQKDKKDDKQQQHQTEQKIETIDAGQMTNLMSEDAFNIMSFFWIAHYIWAIPLKIGIVMFLLYKLLGISAIIGSIFCIATMTPLQFLIGKMMSSNSERTSESTDERLKRINEVLLGVKLIKLNAWENVFKEKINHVRRKELHYLDLDSIYWTLMTCLTHISSVLVTFVTFAVYTAIELDVENDILINKLTASRVFAALALFNQLTVPLFIFPITVPIIIQAIISTKRLEKFLGQHEVQKEEFEGVRNMARILSKSDASLDVYEKDECIVIDKDDESGMSEPKSAPTTPTTIIAQPFIDFEPTPQPQIPKCHQIATTKTAKLRKGKQVSVCSKIERNRLTKTNRIGSHSNLRGGQTSSTLINDNSIVLLNNCEYLWNKNDCSKKLVIKNLEIPKSKLTIIVGKNGSGKTSLLSALLKEMHTASGDVKWNKYSTIAFVPQQSFLMSTTIRDNILFGEPYRDQRYKKVLDVCALKPDIDLMPNGDSAQIGEFGINLSGGQRQRIAIARALYSSANVILMDDPFSSLDNEVAKHIMKEAINEMLLKYRRTAVLVTQRIQLVYTADFIVAMEDNIVRASGTLQELDISDPNLTREWNIIVARENSKELLLSPGKTARERWKLFKNITKLGLQKIGCKDDDTDVVTSQSLYHPISRKRSSIYGSRHLTHDLPLPIDECHNDDIELRRNRLTSVRHSGLNSFLSTFDFDGNHRKNNVLRANSLQVQTTNRIQRMPVIRNVSSPTTLQTVRTSTEIQPTTFKMSFRKFLRRMSSRRSTSSGASSINTSFEQPSSTVTLRDRRKVLQKTLSSTGSIKSIDEESDLHPPVKRLISTISVYSEENENDDAILNGDEEEITTSSVDNNNLIYNDERKYGKIPTRIHFLYINASGYWVVTIFFLCAISWQSLRVYTDVWLRDWTNNMNNNDYNDNNDPHDRDEIYYYFKIYGILSVISIILSLISTPFGQLAGSRARKLIHNKLIDSLLKSSLFFFQTTSIGRIMNRFSNDMSVIDKKIASTSQRLLQFLLLCLCAILINTIITPWFIIITIPICLIYYIIQTFYRCSSRELQRIESITISPIIKHFSETLNGVTTIRAYGQESRFMEILFKYMESNNITLIILNTSNRWLGIALDYLGGFIVFIAMITSLTTSYFYPLSIEPSLVGLAINYTLLVPIYLNWVVKLLADMEMYIGAVERIQYFIDENKQHQEQENAFKTVPISWPQKGDIVFENVTLKYENQKNNIITGMNLTIPAGQRIGICGRTGSGKSSLAMSLFGVLVIADGRILIDDVNISTIHLDELRSRLSIIPQDVVLFSGTIRENLDPRGHYTDGDLWNCLEMAQLKELITNTSSGLDTQINEGGINLSAGQKQSFCLARAILRGSVCLILDEATSSLDSATELLLLQAANRSFQGRTVITIAHRLTTILDYDRVIVLENGNIVEDGNPQVLKNILNGKFATMLKASMTSISNT